MPVDNIDFPVFFVIGAAKAATSSLYFYLKQHPEIYMHEYKDVACYFCDSYGLKLTGDYPQISKSENLCILVVK